MRFPTFEVNIGLTRNDGQGSLSPGYVHDAIQQMGLLVVARRVAYANHTRGGEDTFIARVIDPVSHTGSTTPTTLSVLAAYLHQDAIAVVPHSDVSPHVTPHLVGPKADEWGPFDPQYFVPFGCDSLQCQVEKSYGQARLSH